MSDFLLELRSEEIPARMQVKAKEDLGRLFAAEIAKAGLVAASIEAFATPRRLALIARGLPDATEAVSEEIKGPKASAPPQALEGFLRKTGLAREQLVERDGVLFAVMDRPGRATAEVLAEAIPAIVRAFPWPKSMRWGAASISTECLRWVRPLQGIVALFGGEIVPCEVDGIVSGATTTGHRFMGTGGDSPQAGTVPVRSADTYVEDLRAAYVLVHLSERTAIIRDGAARLAGAAGLRVIEDEALVIENAGLTEWPVPLLGSFDRAFLDVPPEVIQLTARVNQKYFVLRDAGGKLAPNFICTANIEASDGGAAIVAGNERVLSARLADAKFFWENDLKVPLAVQAEKLSQIVFHEKLGTVADKVDRVAKLARWLVTENIVRFPERSEGAGRAERDPLPQEFSLRSNAPLAALGQVELADLAERAARLCKADLVTGMVGEFPELQGIIGGYLAHAQGEPEAVSNAIRDHYKPVGQGDDVPTDPVTVAVSLADKLDTIAMFFAIGEPPTGSRDPFALRRAALGVVALVQPDLRLPLSRALRIAAGERMKQLCETTMPDGTSYLRYYKAYDEAEDQAAYLRERQQSGDPLIVETFQPDDCLAATAFLADRLKVQQREAGVRHDLIDAVFAIGGEDDLVRLLARVKALQAFVGTAEGANLLAGYKRAANILKKEAPVEGTVPSSGTVPLEDKGTVPKGGQSPVEIALLTALETAEPRATAAIEAEDFAAAMSALAGLREPIDAFFEGVMVNDPDPQVRGFRLGLLARFRDAVHKVADFSKIEG